MAASKELPSVEVIRKLLSYNPDNGEFRWLPRTDRCHAPAGAIAGGDHNLKYRQISIFNVRYYSHRLAWKYVYGVDPPDQIDHINNDPSDNRISNLRVSDQSQNLANKRRKSTAKYPKGVSAISQKRGTWYAVHAGYRGKAIFVGHFPTVEEASAAYIAKAREIHGEFANAG
jgi:hypothetical protein